MTGKYDLKAEQPAAFPGKISLSTSKGDGHACSFRNQERKPRPIIDEYQREEFDRLIGLAKEDNQAGKYYRLE